MKKKGFLLLFVAILIAGLGYSIFQNRSFLSQSPLQKSKPFENLFNVISDRHGHEYMITKSKESILMLNTSGTLQYQIDLVRGTDGSLNNFNDLAVDSKGYLYALQTGLDAFGLYVKNEQIVRYKPDGKFDKLLYNQDFDDKSNLLRVGTIRSLQVYEDSLFFYTYIDKKIQLNQLNHEEATPVKAFSFTLPKDLYLSEITGSKPGEIYLTTKTGKIYEVSKTGDLKLLFPLSGDNNPMKSVPIRITLDNNKNLYFINSDNNDVYRIPVSEPAKIELVYTKAPDDTDTENLVDLANLMDGHLLLASSDRITKIDGTNQILSQENEAAFSKHLIQLGYLFWLQVLAAVILLLWSIRYYYVHFMNRRISLLLKQIIVFVPLVIASLILLSILIYSSYSKELLVTVGNNLKLLSHNGQNIIDGDKLEKLTSAKDYMNENYVSIKASKNAVFSGGAGRDGLYSTLYKYENNQIYRVMDDDDSETMFRKFPSDEDNSKVINEGQIVVSESRDETGFFKYAIGPLYTSQGKIIGIYEIGRDMNAFDRHKRELILKVVEGILGITLVIIIVFLFLSYYLLSSIRTLRRSVVDIAGGNWNTVVNIQSRDEVADLGDNFNHMAQSIQMYISNITKLNEANNRFVPRQFLQYLGKESIQNVELGDQVEQEMGILILNMQSFYEFSKNLTPKENFNFINSFLNRFGPIVRKNEGMINKYLGAGIMALFPNRAEDSLDTAIEMRQMLDVYNTHRLNSGYSTIDISIGIHRGPLMLGIIGEEKRMEGNVISDNVNIAGILEKMSNSMGVSILITDEIYKVLTEPKQYESRSLGMVYIEGKDEPIHLYDVFQGDPEHVRKLKLKTKATFEIAVEAYQNGRFYDAREAFLEVIKLNRWDKAARLYFYLADDCYQNGASEKWIGALNVS
ncbi:HAMP domain-containing protein [Paenibacillus psychroresistens]|uniref:HAMP domain-containing protein n=1 Tax=Paenibacillus psychroresistens TaxID=1778678 RepID=A0A6B8RM62_9BACL|nr:adenylate/guanylate cyclase domain-containing protein [Paenibacillus psychroresistens]QGQ96633.1 HAMP domain-containing protein [Paenibacillus psychroresistens]